MLQRKGYFSVTDTPSKDSKKILNDLSSPYGCYGFKTVEGMSVFIDQWRLNGGDENALRHTVMIIDMHTRHMTMWMKEVFKKCGEAEQRNLGD
jgi:hypothetical protein